jgi:hypothetical protein
MKLNYPLRDCETEPRASEFAAARFVYPVETFENSRLIPLRDTDACVFHRYLNPEPDLFRGERNSARRGRVLKGVVEQNVDHPAQGIGIAHHRKALHVQPVHELQIAQDGNLTPLRAALSQYREKVNGMNIQRFTARVRAGQRQKLFQKFGGSFGLAENVPQCLLIFTFITRSSQGELGLSMNKGNGSPQFVRCIGGKLRDPQKCGLDALRRFDRRRG